METEKFHPTMIVSNIINFVQSTYNSDNFTGFTKDPIIWGLFVFFFVFGVVFDKLWTKLTKRKNNNDDVGKSKKGLQRKESVEWVNMIISKLWKFFRGDLENWVIGMQPLIDDLQKPDYVERVEIQQFSLGDEPFVFRNIQCTTSRSINDLQFQIGVRYTGGARMLLILTLKFGIKVPVVIRDFDIDGELWVKSGLIPTKPWVGPVSWGLVSLPKINFDLSPFQLINLMKIPFLSMFLKKLLTEDLPLLFVRPKIVKDFQKGKAVGPLQNDFKSGEAQEGTNKDFSGELSVILVDARKLAYAFLGKTDPYVELRLGDQVIDSKKSSRTTVIGPPGQPIWNQDFRMLVTNPKKEKLMIHVKDSLGFIHLTVGAGEVDLGLLKDKVPTDRIVTLQGGWGLLNKVYGEVLLRLTYKAYVQDEEDEKILSSDNDASDDEFQELESTGTTYNPSRRGTERSSFMDVLAALNLSKKFQGILVPDNSS